MTNRRQIFSLDLQRFTVCHPKYNFILPRPKTVIPQPFNNCRKINVSQILITVLVTDDPGYEVLRPRTVES